jgi:flagellar biogenesis protein FliO
MTAAILLLQAARPVDEIGSLNSEPLQYVKLIVVLAVVLGLAYLVIHSVLPRIAGTQRLSSGAIRVAARLPLEPRKNLYVIRVGDDYYLVGTSESGLHYLTALAPDRIEPALHADAPAEREFATLFQAFRRSKRSS